MGSGVPWNELIRLITLQDPNSRVVLAGTLLLGIASGVVGSFVLLTRRAMVGDALSHAALPGLCLAFMILGTKDLFWLLIGALLSGLLGVVTMKVIATLRRVSSDAAIGIVLTVFFGAGVCLSRIIQNTPTGTQAGLDTFIYGKAASMLVQDAWLIGIVCLTVVGLCTLFFKELLLICFDPDFGRTTGWPVGALDLLLMVSLVATVMVGLQSVGVVLVIALLITPAATARFWTERLSTMVILSAFFGGASALIGASISALYGRLPTGPLIVIVAAILFLASAAIAPRRGVLAHFIQFRSLQRTIQQEHLLRRAFEALEIRGGRGSRNDPARREKVSSADSAQELSTGFFTISDLTPARGEERGRVLRDVRRLVRNRYLAWAEESGAPEGRRLMFTEEGRKEALRVVRNHRLWELYLINFADVAPSHVDTSADRIEHILSPEIIARLEAELASLSRHGDFGTTVPRSPHTMTSANVTPGSSGGAS